MNIDLKYFFERLAENTTAKLIISSAGSMLAFLFGGFGTILNSFVCLLFIDLITGVSKAYKYKMISSRVGRQSGKKIVTYALIIIFANLLEQAGLKGIRSFAILWASVTEGISIIENLDALGIPMPEFIREKLLQTRNDKFGDKRKDNIQKAKVQTKDGDNT